MDWKPSKLSKGQQEERRLEGGRLLLQGKMTQAQIARHLGVSDVAVALWKQRLEAGNRQLKALNAKPSGSPTPQLSQEQWQELVRIILKGAVAAGFQTERWTLPRIAELVKQRWGVNYSGAWLSIRLRQLGLSVQRPTTVAGAKDEQQANQWLEERWPAIKKKRLLKGQ